MKEYLDKKGDPNHKYYIKKTEAAVLTDKAVNTIHNLCNSLKSPLQLALLQTEFDLIGIPLVIKTTPAGKKRETTLILKDFVLKRFGLIEKEKFDERTNLEKKVDTLVNEVSDMKRLLITLTEKINKN